MDSPLLPLLTPAPLVEMVAEAVDTLVLEWGFAAHKSLAGAVTFYDGPGGLPQETVSWEVGYCVHYGEDFDDGTRDGTRPSYLCHLRLAPTGDESRGPAGGHAPGARTGPRQSAGRGPYDDKTHSANSKIEETGLDSR